MMKQTLLAKVETCDPTPSNNVPSLTLVQGLIINKMKIIKNNRNKSTEQKKIIKN